MFQSYYIVKKLYNIKYQYWNMYAKKNVEYHRHIKTFFERNEFLVA